MIEERLGSRIVLEYEVRRADFLEAIRLILRKRRSGFVYRLPFIVATGLLGVVTTVAGLLEPGDFNPFAPVVLLFALLLYSYPHLSARQFLKANEHQGTVRVTADDEGIHVVTAHSDSRVAWSSFGSYAESDTVFILRTPDRAGRCANFLAKRGVADPADVDRLRELLGRHLRRV